MTKTTHPAALAAAEAIAADLSQLERSVTETLSRAHAIGQTLLEGQVAARISPTFGQSMFDDVALIINTTTGLRGQIGQMHNRMSRHAGRLNIAVTAGGMEKPPERDGNETPWRKTAHMPEAAD